MVTSAGVKSPLTALTNGLKDHLPLANKHNKYKQWGSNNSWQTWHSKHTVFWKLDTCKVSLLTSFFVLAEEQTQFLSDTYTSNCTLTAGPMYVWTYMHEYTFFFSHFLTGLMQKHTVLPTKQCLVLTNQQFGCLYIHICACVCACVCESAHYITLDSGLQAFVWARCTRLRVRVCVDTVSQHRNEDKCVRMDRVVSEVNTADWPAYGD